MYCSLVIIILCFILNIFQYTIDDKYAIIDSNELEAYLGSYMSYYYDYILHICMETPDREKEGLIRLLSQSNQSFYL
jgi:hypothetical protein